MNIIGQRIRPQATASTPLTNVQINNISQNEKAQNQNIFEMAPTSSILASAPIRSYTTIADPHQYIELSAEQFHLTQIGSPHNPEFNVELKIPLSSLNSSPISAQQLAEQFDGLTIMQPWTKNESEVSFSVKNDHIVVNVENVHPSVWIQMKPNLSFNNDGQHVLVEISAKEISLTETQISNEPNPIYYAKRELERLSDGLESYTQRANELQSYIDNNQNVANEYEETISAQQERAVTDFNSSPVLRSVLTKSDSFRNEKLKQFMESNRNTLFSNIDDNRWDNIEVSPKLFDILKENGLFEEFCIEIENKADAIVRNNTQTPMNLKLLSNLQNNLLSEMIPDLKNQQSKHNTQFSELKDKISTQEKIVSDLSGQPDFDTKTVTHDYIEETDYPN